LSATCAVGVADDLPGVELNDAAPTLNVDRQANRAAPVVVGIEEGRPGVALMDRLAGSRDRVLVLVWTITLTTLLC